MCKGIQSVTFLKFASLCFMCLNKFPVVIVHQPANSVYDFINGWLTLTVMGAMSLAVCSYNGTFKTQWENGCCGKCFLNIKACKPILLASPNTSMNLKISISISLK